MLINCILETSTATFPAADFFCQMLRALECSNFKLRKLFFSDGARDEYHPLLKSFRLGRARHKAGGRDTLKTSQKPNVLWVP